MYYVLGSGSIGRRHHDNLGALGAESRLLGWRGLDLDAFEGELAQATGLVIATATQVRLPLIALAARHGVPVYVEKPLAFRLADVAETYRILEPIAARSVLGVMMRYHPAVRELVQAGHAAYGFHFEIGHDVRQWRANWSFAESYAAQAEGGGVLLDLCHEIDMAHCLWPDVEVVAVDCVGHPDFPGVDFATCVHLAGGDAVGTVAMDYLAPSGVRRMSLRGQEAIVDVDLLAGRQTIWQDGRENSQKWEHDRNDMFLGLMRDFMALAEGRPVSDTRLLPRLDRVQGSVELVAKAWEARRFRGQATGDFT